MNDLQKNSRQNQIGFSLIELMVGLAMGLLVTLIVTQTMGTFETQSRSTTGSADAQTNGNMALFTIGRELKQAGFALMPSGEAGVADSPYDCTALNLNTSGVNSIIPYAITDGVAVAGVSNASDTITIRYGNSPTGGGKSILNDDATNIAALRSVDSNLGCNVNDTAIIMNAGVCDLTRVTAVSNVAVVTDPQTVTLSDAIGSAGNDFACLGPWTEVVYDINNAGELTRNGTPMISDVVNIQAQYGISIAASSNQVNQWVEPTGATWAAPSAANLKLIKAIRVAVVTRNPQIDRDVVTQVCSSRTLLGPTGLCAWEAVLSGGAITTDSPAPLLDLSQADADWDRYRYSVFETVIPLRNGIWAKDTL